MVVKTDLQGENPVFKWEKVASEPSSWWYVCCCSGRSYMFLSKVGFMWNPMSNAIAAIGKIEPDPLDYVHSCYKRPSYDRAYEGYISPMPSSKEWRKTTLVPIKPPMYHKQPGRPKTRRKKGS